MKENFPYLFWAYNLIWLFIAAYLALLGLRQRALRRQLDELKARLGGSDKR